MEMKELFLLEEFQEYRRKEVEIAAEYIQRLWGGADPQYVRGAVEVVSKILSAPESYAKGTESKEFLQALTSRDFATFEAKFLRRILADGEEKE